jgi:hypothetical protein
VFIADHVSSKYLLTETLTFPVLKLSSVFEMVRMQVHVTGGVHNLVEVFGMVA